MQEQVAEKANKLNRLKLSQAEIVQKLAFYQAQSERLASQVDHLQSDLETDQRDLRKESDAMLLTRSTLEAVKKNRENVKGLLGDFVRKTQSQLNSLSQNLTTSS